MDGDLYLRVFNQGMVPRPRSLSNFACNVELVDPEAN